uniref:Phenoloxidase-activating factor 2 n=1 Tax=Ceratitis capitata TaxID=7213 RepID=W8BCT1_CERCA
MPFYILCLLSLWTSLTQTQSTPNLQDYWSKIFSTTTRPLQSQPDRGSLKVCGLNKECVQRFLCEQNGEVNRYGKALINIRFGADIAEEDSCTYLETCCDVNVKLTVPNVRIKPVKEGCGYRNLNGIGFQITGDKEGESEFGEFPWMVAIFREEMIGGVLMNVYECGGSVLAPNVVLTTAHCVIKAQILVYRLIARAGEWDMQSTQEVLPHQDALVKEVIIHEQYDSSVLFNDVALLILETPFKWEANVRPICLPDADVNFDYSRCFATGWGRDKFGINGTHQLILKKMELPVIPSDTCQANLRSTRLGRHFRLHSSFMCAGGEKDKDACTGDGGSPLVCPDPRNSERYYQAGIVAWGIGCGTENVPGVYANVAYLRNWINDQLNARLIDFRHFTAQLF